MLNILPRKKNEYQMLQPNLFFHRRNTATPFHMKIVKHACDTNTNIHKKIQNFLETFDIFFCGTVHPPKRPSHYSFLT